MKRILSKVSKLLDRKQKMMMADYVVLNYEGNPRSRQVGYIHAQLLESC